MIPRQLEPEVMDTKEEAVDYNSMDHTEVNRLFAEEVLGLIKAADQRQIEILDLGTGTALIPIEICQRNSKVRMIATDLANEMLKLAEWNLRQVSLDHLISLEQADAKNLSYDDHVFDGVISNSLIHHIPDPQIVLSEVIRVVKRGGFLFLRDLLRPDSYDELENLVELYAGQAIPHQRKLFRDSLHAALTLNELQGMLEECGLPTSAAKVTSDRHWTISLALTEAS